MSFINQLLTFPTDYIHDNSTDKSYLVGRFLGQGSFGKCYEIKDTQTGRVFAIKIISKSTPDDGFRSTEDITREISIQKSLKHKYIINLHSFFDNDQDTCMVLELCSGGTLLKMQSTRKTLTIWEIRYFMKQLLTGVSYLHRNNIVHRDLKLSNILLNDDLQVKIEPTPAEDIRGLGSVMYTLLTSKSYYGSMNIPKRVQNTPAIYMISRMLCSDPTKRPTASELLRDEIFHSGFIPWKLPPSCKTLAPSLQILKAYNNVSVSPSMTKSSKAQSLRDIKNIRDMAEKKSLTIVEKLDNEVDGLLKTLDEQLSSLSVNTFNEILGCSEESPDWSHEMPVWINKWVDHSTEFGLAYQSSDGDIGVLFNDGTQLIIPADNKYIHYINRCGDYLYFNSGDYPWYLNHKIQILKFSDLYMENKLDGLNGSFQSRDFHRNERPPHVHRWFRTQKAIVMFLSNGLFQINFRNHTKIFLCPSTATAWHVDKTRKFLIHRLATLRENGCCTVITKYLKYIRSSLNLLISNTFHDIIHEKHECKMDVM
ncbi:hypothetical protein QAD02_000855 [Eretmocerus hayati]|uniref:Uncharacterized protein n=1 Tax=Eretmocerus hayati TaxID=131215 RepID=A0ACC2NG02_9HYME|nr:hypothetical protein QAD02_000855 [Eretmocerus hayati]